MSPETTERNITGGATSNIRRLISEADLQESGKFHSDEVGDIFQRSKHELIEVKRTGNAMLFYENMFQILHCFVLPIIKFTKSDLNYLDASKEGEISIIQNQDQRIEAQQQDLSLIGNSLSAIRNDLVETLIAHHERYNGTDNMMRLKMDRVVATVIIADLKDDLKQCSYNLNYEQTVVDVLNRQREKLMYDCDTNDTGHDVMKERVRTSFHMENKRNSPAELEVLTQLFMKNSGLVNNRIEVARKKRNQVQTKQNKLLIARELIQDYVSKNKRQNSTFRRIMKKTQVKIKPLDKGRNTEYMYLHIRRKKLKAGLMELVMEKVVMISIREAIESTIKELASGDIKDESCGGLYNKSGTKKFTDVRGSARNNIPQNWQTMEEQIHNILTDPQNNIAHIHCEAFADFVFRCDIINAKLALKDHSSRENNGTEIADRYSANTEESSLATLEMLNKDIVDHMERICNELNMALKEKFNFNSIWLCYENELFCKVGPLLENINKLVFKNKLEDIEKYIKRIAPSSLGREFETSKVYSLLEETVITEALVNDKPDQQHTVGNSVENIERTNDDFLNSKDVKCQSENKDDCNSDQNSYSGTMSSSESSTEDEDDQTSSQLPSTSNASEIEENALIKTVTDAGNACVIHRRTSSKKRLASNHGCDTKTRLDYSKSVPINSESIMSGSIRVSRYGDLLQSLTSDIEVNRSPKRINTWPYLLRIRMQSRSFFNSPIYASQDSSEVIGDKEVTNSGGHTSMIEPDYITFRETMVVQRQKATNLQEVNRKVNTMNLKPCYKEGFQKVYPSHCIYILLFSIFNLQNSFF